MEITNYSYLFLITISNSFQIFFLFALFNKNTTKDWKLCVSNFVHNTQYKNTQEMRI